ncbi:MAG: InlB B-repeat-containing protein [Mobilitalea sp.]
MKRKKQLTALVLTFILVFSCLPAINVLAANYDINPIKGMHPAYNTNIFAGDTLTNDSLWGLDLYYYENIDDFYADYNSPSLSRQVRIDNVNPGGIYTVLDAAPDMLTAPAGTELEYWTVKYVACSSGYTTKITLVPNWVASVPTASQTSGSTVKYGDTVTLSVTSGAAIYYTADGSTPSITSTVYTSPIAINADVTIKAFSVLPGYHDSSVVTFTYAVGPYTITYDRNGGNTEAIPATMSVTSGSAISILPTAPTRPGYTFTAWNTEANGSGTAFTASTTVTTDLTVYAQWTVIPSGGSGTTSGGSTILQGWVQNDAGKRLYYKDGKALTGTQTIDGVNYLFDGDGFLVEDQVQDTYKIGYDKNTKKAVIGVPDYFTEHEAEEVVIVVGTPYSISMFFAGWNTKADGSGTSYTAGDSITISENITLYAQWEESYTSSDGLKYLVTGSKKISCVGTTKVKEKSVKIPDAIEYHGITYKITSIGEKAFNENNNITSVSIGNNVKIIGKEAFFQCKNLKTVKIGTGLVTLDQHVFCHAKKGCVITINSTKLKKVKTAINHGVEDMTIMVPDSKLTNYKELFAEQSKTIIVKANQSQYLKNGFTSK